jgi:hypothetical protein
MTHTTLRYDLYGATLKGDNENAWKKLEGLGCVIIKSETFPMGDCIYFEVENCPKILPKFIEITTHNFK